MNRFISSLVLSLLFVLSYAPPSADTTPPSPCTQLGFAPNPDSTQCQSYYVCTDDDKGGYTANLMQCPWPLVFSSATNTCTSRSSTSCLTPYTPCAYASGAQPDAGDCSHFFLCSFGIGTLMQCPSGLAYNPAGYCDWPANVDCSHTFCGQTPTPTTAYSYFDYAAGVTCDASNAWVTQAYPFDATRHSAAMCYNGYPIIIYCCGNSKNVIGSYSVCA